MIYDALWNYLMLKRKNVLIGKSLKINGRIYIHGSKGRIRIGDNCIIQSSHYCNPTSGFDHTHLVAGRNGFISIGNHVGLSHVNITSYNRIVIEDNVLIGSGVKIWDTDFHSVVYENRMSRPDPDVKGAPVNIREGSFIGACSIILKGVTVGRYSVVGAGSVVTRDIPDGEIWAGNPAVCIRR